MILETNNCSNIDKSLYKVISCLKKIKIQAILDVILQNNDRTTQDFVIPGYAARPVISYQSMREDLLLCRDALLELGNAPSRVIQSSLFYTIVLLYAKCFTDTSSSKTSQLKKDIFDEQSEQLLKTPEELLEMRHNIVAHRGSSEHDFGFAYISMGMKDLPQ